jgi:Ca-activated chloride channel family protein
MFEQLQLAPEAQGWIHLVWLVPLAAVLHLWSRGRRQRKLAVFGFDREKSAPWLRSLHRNRLRKAVLFCLGAAFLTAAAVQPRCNPEKTRFKTSARDIAILLDVSRSMLAEDLLPNRLERAKLEVARLCDQLRGDRIGLIVFAGEAVIKSPLTSNYSYFKSVLRNVDTRSAATGGTKIGDAVLKAVYDLFGLNPAAGAADGDGVQAGETVLEAERRQQRETFADILLITDGENLESHPVRAAEIAASVGLGIYAVGLGSETGSRIPIRGADGKLDYVRDRAGNEHLSKLDSKTLQDMVNASPRGAYLPVGTYNFDLVSFHEKQIAPEGGRELFEENISWTEIFQPFLLAGFVLYLAHLLLSERPRQGQLAPAEVTP